MLIATSIRDPSMCGRDLVEGESTPSSPRLPSYDFPVVARRVVRVADKVSFRDLHVVGRRPQITNRLPRDRRRTTAVEIRTRISPVLRHRSSSDSPANVSTRWDRRAGCFCADDGENCSLSLYVCVCMICRLHNNFSREIFNLIFIRMLLYSHTIPSSIIIGIQIGILCLISRNIINVIYKTLRIKIFQIQIPRTDHPNLLQTGVWILQYQLTIPFLSQEEINISNREFGKIRTLYPLLPTSPTTLYPTMKFARPPVISWLLHVLKTCARPGYLASVPTKPTTAGPGLSYICTRRYARVRLASLFCESVPRTRLPCEDSRRAAPSPDVIARKRRDPRSESLTRPPRYCFPKPQLESRALHSAQLALWIWLTLSGAAARVAWKKSRRPWDNSR